MDNARKNIGKSSTFILAISLKRHTKRLSDDYCNGSRTRNHGSSSAYMAEFTKLISSNIARSIYINLYLIVAPLIDDVAICNFVFVVVNKTSYVYSHQ